MRPDGVVEADPLPDDPFGQKAVGDVIQIDRLVFERPPQPLDEDIVHTPAPSIHGYRDLHVLENAGKLEAGELAALIGIEDVRFAVAVSTDRCNTCIKSFCWRLEPQRFAWPFV